MPLLHRVELLQRQRVDPAQHAEGAFGGPQPLLLLARGRTGAAPASRRPRPSARTVRPGQHRHQLVGAVVGDQRLRSRARARSAPSRLSASTRMRCSARAISSRCAASTSVSKSCVSVRTAARAALSAGFGLGPRPPRPRRAARPPAASDRSTRPARYAAPACTAAAVRASRRHPLAAGHAPGRGPAARSRRPGAGRRRGRPGPGPAPPACAARAGRPSRPPRASRASSASRSRSAGSGSVVVGGLRRSGEPLLQLGQPRHIAVPGLLGASDRLAQPLGLVVGGPGGRAELAELLGQRRHRRVRLVQPGQRHLDGVRRGLAVPLVELALGEPQPVGRCGSPRLSRSLGVVDRGLHLDQARLGARAAGGEVRAQHVAVPGDRDQVGERGDQGPGGGAGPRPRRPCAARGVRRRCSWTGACDHLDGLAERRRAAPASRRSSIGRRSPRTRRAAGRPGRGPRP